MKLSVIFFILLGTYAFGQSTSDSQEIENLLIEFLSRVDEEAMHDRFWSEELIYTGSSGRRIGKSVIMDGFKNQTNEEGPKTTYAAEEIQIRLKNNIAILAFKLVASTETDDGVSVSNYYNSGTLQKEKGQWKVILWQATKIPE